MARTFKEIQALEPTKVENKLIDACKRGVECVLNDGERPRAADPECTIRAEILRYLILGGSRRCVVHQKGVQLSGAWIVGELDLSFCKANGPTEISSSVFSASFLARQAELEALDLSGSIVRWFEADGANVKGDVFFAHGFVAIGQVSLAGCAIGGQFSCTDGKFSNATRVDDNGDLIGGIALDLEGAHVKGDVFFRGAKKRFTAKGSVNLAGIEIEGQLSLYKSSFLSHEGHAISAQNMTVRQSFIWKDCKVLQGLVQLTFAHVADLDDDVNAWPKSANKLQLGGFTYDRIVGSVSDISPRLEWLKLGSVHEGNFQPQPYSQLAKVLRNLGHNRASREVLIEQSRLLSGFHRKKFRRKLAFPPSHRVQQPYGDELSIRWPRWVVSSYTSLWAGFDAVVRAVVGYGYAPFRSIGWLLGLWLIASLMASAAWDDGAMVPNSDVVLTSPGWIAVEAQEDAAHVWSRGAGRDYETFSPAQWGFDAVVPIINVGQTDAWAPSTARGAWGKSLWWGRWLLGIAGWIVAALAAAAVTGIIRKDDE